MKAEAIYQWWLQRVYQVQRWERSVQWLRRAGWAVGVVFVLVGACGSVERGSAGPVVAFAALGWIVVSCGEIEWHKRRANEWRFEASVVTEALAEEVQEERRAAGY